MQTLGATKDVVLPTTYGINYGDSPASLYKLERKIIKKVMAYANCPFVYDGILAALSKVRDVKTLMQINQQSAKVILDKWVMAKYKRKHILKERIKALIEDDDAAKACCEYIEDVEIKQQLIDLLKLSDDKLLRRLTGCVRRAKMKQG